VHANETVGACGAAASLVIEMDEVLDATITSGATSASICLRMLELELEVLGGCLDHECAHACRSSYLVLPLNAGQRGRLVSLGDLFLFEQAVQAACHGGQPLATAASEMSTITTSSPATAQACAMPLPMVPAPTMPTVLMLMMHRC
jgi:hypothetical protein